MFFSRSVILDKENLLIILKSTQLPLHIVTIEEGTIHNNDCGIYTVAFLCFLKF